MAFDPGSPPVSDAIMCEMPAPVADPKDSCATAAEADDPANLSLTQAATALATNQKSSIALDWSPAALSACFGLPRKVTYLAGAFPDGMPLCLNCAQQIPNVYATPAKACIAKCQDLITFGNGVKPADITAYCIANATTAPNYDANICYNGACTSGGTPDPAFVDPRRAPEPLVWIDLIDTALGATPNTLVRSAPTSASPNFDAGAASAQIILSGDAWVEFSTTDNTLGHMLGVRNSCPDAAQCPDVSPFRDELTNALLLHENGEVYVQEGDPWMLLPPSFGPYSAGERYRIHITDNHDGTATVSYARYTGACGPATCPGDVFHTSVYQPAYPLRVDATLRVQNATLSDVTLVYRKP
jgi:hypothetical protein